MRRLFVFFAVVGAVAIARCGGSHSTSHDAGVETRADGGSPDASSDGSGPSDGGAQEDGGAPDASSAPSDGGDVPDAGVPNGGSRLACTFNSDCPANERCACDEAEGCLCLTGPRGAGRSGIDACVSGNDCESSLCVEGWGGYFCSGPCTSDTDCGPRLPVCTYISFIGDICIRQRPVGGR